MVLSRIIISEINEQQVIYLREVEGDRTFPILIGIFEAHSIDRKVKRIPTPRSRPNAHSSYSSTTPSWSTTPTAPSRAC
jgi:bifunctional DNase/RNase